MPTVRRIPETGLVAKVRDVASLQNRLAQFVASFAGELQDFAEAPVHGRIYPASSVDYRHDHGLIQKTSSPSYWGGVWSLTSCKHDMRQEHFYPYLRETNPGVLRPTEPLFIFTCAGTDGSDRPEWAAERRRWLASVALVTHAFTGMADYGRDLLEHGEEAWQPRISTQDKADAPAWAIKHGDCHAVIDGGEVQGVGAPYPEHDHVSSSGTVTCGCNQRVDSDHAHAYHDDNVRSSLKFMSTPGFWISWSEPAFYWTKRSGRGRWGGGEDKLAYRSERKLPARNTIMAELQAVF